MVGVLLALGAATLLCTFWVGARGALAATHLTEARDAASALQQTALDDPASTATAVAGIAEDTGKARELTSDPVWRIGEALPWAGPQLRAISTLAAALDDTVAGAVAPLVEVFSTLDASSFAPRDGAVDLEPLIAARDEADAASRRAQEAADVAAAIDTTPLLGALRGPVEQGVQQLAEVATATQALRNATILLPAMLGAEAPRDNLLLFQNSAEWRSLGGIAGTMALLSADGGRIELGSQASSTSFSRYDTPVLPLDPEVETIYETRVARHVQNATQVPDFTIGAPLAAEFWKRATGTAVDSVIAIDPVAISYVLTATGPVELPSGDTLTSDNAVRLLLNEVYLRYPDPAAQDAFFSQATASVFAAVTDGQADPAALLSALTRAGAEDRLLIWNADPAEQAVLDGTSLQGRLPATDGASSRFGVYVNDVTGAKLDYYMSLGAVSGWCTPGPQATASLRVQLDNGAPVDVTALPDYLIARTVGSDVSTGGVPIGVTRVLTYVYLPEGATLLDQIATSGAATVVGAHQRHQVVAWWSDTAPGESATLDLRVQMRYTERLEVRATPTVRKINPSELGVSCSRPE